jgi:hypothetical protein
MSMILTALEALDAFRRYVEQALPSLTEVVEAKQRQADAQRAALPYGTVEWRGSTAMSSAPRTRLGDEDYPDDPGGLTHSYHIQELRQGTVELVLYAEDGPELTDDLDTYFHTLAARKFRHDEGITFRPLGDTLDTRDERDTAYEPSALRQYAVIYAVERTEQRGIITSASADPTYLPPKE